MSQLFQDGKFLDFGPNATLPSGVVCRTTRIEGANWRETVNLTLGQPYATHGAGLALVSAEPGKLAGSPPSPPASLFGFEPR